MTDAGRTHFVGDDCIPPHDPLPAPTPGEYTCEMCRGTFAKARSDSEARQESVYLWGHLPADNLALVCDDCFHRLTDAGG